MDNGWDTRRSLLGAAAVRSALRSPFADRSPPRFHRRGLSEGLPHRVLLSVTGLWCLVVVVIICGKGRFVKPLSRENFSRFNVGNFLAPNVQNGGAALRGVTFSRARESNQRARLRAENPMRLRALCALAHRIFPLKNPRFTGELYTLPWLNLSGAWGLRRWCS